MTLNAWKCLRCPHVWPNKREKKPIRCPRCGSPYWDIPKLKIDKLKQNGL